MLIINTYVNIHISESDTKILEYRKTDQTFIGIHILN